jgi:hypothetical protein
LERIVGDLVEQFFQLDTIAMHISIFDETQPQIDRLHKLISDHQFLLLVAVLLHFTVFEYPFLAHILLHEVVDLHPTKRTSSSSCKFLYLSFPKASISINSTLTS